jgi:YVTN family beta-propeller protein
VKFFSLNGAQNIYVPLGGDLMTPGNEVAVVQNQNLLTRLKVGVRPQRIAIHPGGLVFVCNQNSNFISIIDPVTNQVLTKGGQPVEIKTEYLCSDLLFVPSGNVQDNDHQFLYVTNRWRHSVLKYRADIIRDGLSNRAIDINQGTPDPNVPNKPLIEITAVGSNPQRMALSEQKNIIFVTNSRGGEIARINVATDTVERRISINAPSIDAVNIGNLIYVPTLMPDRGFLANDDTHPTAILNSPMMVQGLDNTQRQGHPGSLFDDSKAYNFEDLRDGLFQLDFRLNNLPHTNQVGNDVYYTDDVSAEPNFQGQQKVLTASVPTAIVRNVAGTRIFVAGGGNDSVQALNVNSGVRPFTVTKAFSFKTNKRPAGLALNEQTNEIYVANWGGETLQIFDANNGTLKKSIDLGYAQPAYPATNIERGEYFFNNTEWSSDKRKSCTSCHTDELIADGIPFGNGATAPVAPHQVKPNYNLLLTDSYFWNGSLSNGDYTSVAFAAQTRTNCEIIEFALVEGTGSNPAARVGNPNNVFTAGAAQDNKCRPVVNGVASLANQADIDAVKAQELQIRNGIIQQVTGLNTNELSRVINAYDVAEMRLWPNPLSQMFNAQQLPSDVSAQITQGKTLFTMAGCGSCHIPGNDVATNRNQFTDNLVHGQGADWIQRFIATYSNDQRILALLPNGLPQNFLSAVHPSNNGSEINVHQDPFDYFNPFCFDNSSCQFFQDPLAVRGNVTEETRRLNLLTVVNLKDPDREFIPGNVEGAPAINTPSLRGAWSQANVLHHGLGHTIKEAIVGPGHVALDPGEVGWAIDRNGQYDVHGATKAFTKDQVLALVRYVESIE